MVTPRWIFGAVLLVGCAVAPFVAEALDQVFYTTVLARAMIWAIAAVSLNLILGYGAMISFGHAVYLGVGAYTVGVCAYHDVVSGWIQWPLGIALSGLLALVFGAISLRTRGVYFIMITMALSQMMYFLAVSAEEYGSDDGLVIYERSAFGVGSFDLGEPRHLYYTILAALVACVYLTHRLVESRFGMVVRGAASNELRMECVGFATHRYRLTCFVIAGMMCGLAGLLWANVEGFVSPDALHWTRSGELIFMVVLGGMGSILGPVAGAFAYWLLSDWLANSGALKAFTEHWHLVFGPFLVLVVLFARRGIDGLFDLGRGGRG